MFKQLTRLSVAAVLLSTLSGCFTLGLNAQDMRQPVSMTATVGRKMTVVRHFKEDMQTWYIVGLIPIATVPGGPGTWTPADKVVRETLVRELNRGGDGIVNLRVTQQFNLVSVAVGIVAGIIGSYIPFVGPILVGALSNIGVTVEGDVVSFGGRTGSLPAGPVITERDGELDLAGVDLRRMLTEACEKARQETLKSHKPALISSR